MFRQLVISSFGAARTEPQPHDVNEFIERGSITQRPMFFKVKACVEQQL